ncbi:MAG: hypothetical protein WDN24_11130 [Sphingomonas sp.]
MSSPPPPAALEAVLDVLTRLQQGNDADAGRAGAGAQRPADLVAFARHLFAERRSRAEVFGAELFQDPVWDLMLELYAATGEGKRVGINSATIAAGVPATTALRYIKMLTQRGIVARDQCVEDSRRVYVRLTDRATQKMTDLLGRMARDRLVADLIAR